MLGRQAFDNSLTTNAKNKLIRLIHNATFSEQSERDFELIWEHAPYHVRGDDIARPMPQNGWKNYQQVIIAGVEDMGHESVTHDLFT